MSGFLEELKRRKVYRVAVAYIVAGGGIIQLASAVFPAWELSSWALRLVILTLLAGFPIALVLAWAFDLTPEGVKATPRMESSRPSHRRRNIAVLLLVGLLISVGAGFFLLPRASARKMDKSIAVLPFESFSDDKENAYFADGIQDDILTNLSKVGELKVISRTSVMSYRGTKSSVREIGKTLGVSAILEGSVRKAGNRVRVNVQLIDAETDEHIWAEDYDRELSDVFAIQTDLAQKIAHELRARLSPSEQAQMSRKPTENGEAYLAFVQAHNLQLDRQSGEHLNQAVELYQRAIQLDPKFALAVANLSALQSWIYHGLEPAEERRESARRLAEEALSLQPDLPEAHLAQGYFLYYGRKDFDGALKEFEIARNGLPNNSEVYLLIGAIQRRQGRWAESTESLKKAVSLSPNDTWPMQNLVYNYQMQRDYAAANQEIDHALTISPKSFALWELKSKLAIEERGDFSVAEKALAHLAEAGAGGAAMSADEAATNAAWARANIFLNQNLWAEALAAMNSVPGEKDPPHFHVFERGVLEGIALRKLGREEEARTAFVAAKIAAEAALREAPNDAHRHANLASALAHLGEKDAAIAEAKRAMELLPESVDAFEGPILTNTLADVYALTGENEKAIALYDALLSRPSGATVSLLKFDPVLEPLRHDPKFQAVLAKHAQ